MGRCECNSPGSIQPRAGLQSQEENSIRSKYVYETKSLSSDFIVCVFILLCECHDNSTANSLNVEGSEAIRKLRVHECCRRKSVRLEIRIKDFYCTGVKVCGVQIVCAVEGRHREALVDCGGRVINLNNGIEQIDCRVPACNGSVLRRKEET